MEVVRHLIERGTPLILQLIFVYFTPFYIFGATLSRFGATICSIVLNYAAYFCEIYRGGIESIPVGQIEAASVLGFTKMQCFLRIQLPQVAKRVLPPTIEKSTYAPHEKFRLPVGNFHCGVLVSGKSGCYNGIG